MKSLNITVPLILLQVLLATNGGAGEKGVLKWMSFNDGIALAKRTGKKVMIDVYTDWCGWCKKMDKDTYTDQAVAAYLNKKYVAIKLNAESSNTIKFQGKSYTEQELAGAFGITGYPSIIFLKDDGEPITVYPGYADAGRFCTVLSFIGENHYLTTKFEDYLASH
jgi:thioredoxin-related protein